MDRNGALFACGVDDDANGLTFKWAFASFAGLGNHGWQQIACLYSLCHIFVLAFWGCGGFCCGLCGCRSVGGGCGFCRGWLFSCRLFGCGLCSATAGCDEQ